MQPWWAEEKKDIAYLTEVKLLNGSVYARARKSNDVSVWNVMLCTWHAAAWGSECFPSPSPPLTPGRSDDAGSGTSAPLWTAWREPEIKKHSISEGTQQWKHNSIHVTIMTHSQG